MSDPNFQPKPARLLFQVVTDKAPPLFDGTKEPPPGVSLHADDVTFGGQTGIQVVGQKGINVQKGQTKERILSDDEQHSLLDAAKAEEAFQKCRTDAKAKTDAREAQFKTYSDAAADQAVKQNQFDAARRAFEQAITDFRAARNDFQHGMTEFGDKNASYAKALTSVLHRESGGLLAKLHITNTPLEDLTKFAQLVNVSGNEGVDDPDTAEPGTQSTFTPKKPLADGGPNPTDARLAAHPTFYKYDSYNFLEPDPEDPEPGSDWDSIKQADPGRPACDDALTHGDGSVTVDLKKKRKTLGDARKRVDDTYKTYCDTADAKQKADAKATDEKTKLDKARADETSSYKELNQANKAAVDKHDEAHKKVAYQPEPPDPQAS